VDKALKSRDATAVLTCSTLPEWRYSLYQYVVFHFFSDQKHTFLRFFGRAEDFSRKYIWPNTYLPTPAIIINAINTASQGRFILDGVENHGFRKYLIGGTYIQNLKY
jgi:cyclopropane-fatty-acyl-phospholipid synthase